MNRHQIALVTFVTLIPLVYFIPDWVSHYLVSGKLANVVISVGIIVPIVSYLVMPAFQNAAYKNTVVNIAACLRLIRSANKENTKQSR